MLLIAIMSSEVEWGWKNDRIKQKLGWVPFLCSKNLWRLGASPIDRPDGGMAGLPRRLLDPPDMALGAVSGNYNFHRSSSSHMLCTGRRTRRRRPLARDQPSQAVKQDITEHYSSDGRINETLKLLSGSEDRLESLLEKEKKKKTLETKAMPLLRQCNTGRICVTLPIITT